MRNLRIVRVKSQPERIYFERKVGEIFSPHFECLESIQDNISTVIVSKTHGLGVMLNCPRTGKALNLSQSVEPEIVDEVLCFGFGDIASVCTKSVAKV